jgi:CBS domain-containing protein
LQYIKINSVVTVLENVSLAEAQLLMLKNNAHLCVTADGTNKSIVKVISEHDLIVAASNPGVLIKEIKRAQTSEELKQIRVRLTDLIKLPFIKYSSNIYLI